MRDVKKLTKVAGDILAWVGTLPEDANEGSGPYFTLPDNIGEYEDSEVIRTVNLALNYLCHHWEVHTLFKNGKQTRQLYVVVEPEGDGACCGCDGG